ncbi:hypothetical protein GCM10010123_27420 [Pilimelia anulata]|uniref:Uncharacterized protein n=2 Tax=Pilimelia anulata TaxID=53371 RepID=A0A8J3FA18_9ACTN|nr:hypothetical protein GCM10010123_27420 [Pilimelia anulata]
MIAVGIYVEDVTGGFVAVLVGGSIIPALFLYRAAPRVSYRRRDALLGPLGIGLVPTVAWRLALLPHRDWRPRPDELRRARWLTDPRHAGTWWLPADGAAPDRPGTPPT